ncbi:reverse transcriptase, partial [Globisporangium splendens]
MKISIQKTIDRARTRRLHSKLYQGLGVLVDKLNEVAKTDQWYSHVQYRLPADLWKQRGCLTPYQMWTTYRISTMQLNLFHPGRIESSACPSNAGCGETKETISHIVWSCKRAQAAWMAFLGRWIGRTLTEQALNLFLPHIASRRAPPGQRSLLRELEKSFGFITPEHSTALQKLWFIVTSSIPVLLWRTRVEIVHERQHVAIEESTKRVWTACVMQVRAVAHRMRALKGEKINATCLSQLLSVLERQDLSRQLEAWATARLYFDGGARGNPGPGGSGWALIFLNERTNRWELKACGYAYMGPQVTNNRCEYSALKDGLAYSAHYLQHYEVKLEVFGDSQMIIASQNGFSSIRQTELQPLAARVNQIIANFAWISWNHTKREQNKMADLLANMAMNSKSAKILTDESRGNDQILLSQVAALLDNDIGATPSKLRNTSLTRPPAVCGHHTAQLKTPAVCGHHTAQLKTPAVCGHHTAQHKTPAVGGHHTAQLKTPVTKPTGYTTPRRLAMKPTNFLSSHLAHPEKNTRTHAATKPDDDLRKMVPAEEEALNAWIMGALVLDAPPAFLACTHTFLQRMGYVKFFEDCLEGTVVAVVPPRISMPEHIAEKTILMQLLASEPAGSAGYKNLCEWIQNVKRLYYTAATRRLTFIVKEQSIATKWHRREIKLRNEKLVLLSTAKLEEEDDRCDIDNVIPHQADVLQYQVRVVAPGLGNDIVGQLIALSTECEVVSIARAPRARDGAYDSNFWVVIFNSEECPPQLKDVTHISAKGFSIFVHHHQRYSRIPCFQCFDPSHPKSKCTRAPGDCQMQFHRDFEPEIKQAKEMSKFELQHMSLEVRQKYIGNLSNSLGKVMANLKSKATEKALLSEMLQPADSSSSTGSAAVAAAANSATDAQSVTPSEAEWFDPANIKKQKGAMKSTISTSATTPVKNSPASKGQPHPASDAASAGRRAPKGGILKAAPKLTSVFGTSPGSVASSGSFGTGSPETSIKASNGQSNRKALQARKKRELELEAILAGKLSSADSVLDGVQANSTQAKQKIAIDARLSAAQATLDIAKEHLSKASSAHTAAAAAAATAKRKFHDVSAKAHSFALDRDELKEADTSGRDEESSSANREAGHFQRQIELLDLQQRVTAKEAAAASLILQEAKNAKNRAKRQLDLLKKRAKAKNLGPKDGDQHAGSKASTTAASGSSPAENTESQGDRDLAYTKLREFVKAHVVHEHSPTAQTQDEEQSRTSQPSSKSFPSASRDDGSANQQPSSEPSADTTSGYSEDPSHFDVTMSLADSTSMDSTMHLQDLTGGAVTPPNGQATLPLPAEVTKAFHQEMRSQNGTEDAGNGAPSMNQPTPGSADQDFGHIDSAESRDADPTGVFGPGPEINAAMGSGLGTGSTDDEHRFQKPEREPDSHSHTLNRPRARKIPELASSVLKAAASTTPGQSEASQESTFANDSESGEFETPPSSPSHSVQDDGQARTSLVGRLVGSKEELEQLTAAEQALRRQHFRANDKAMRDWTTATRQNRRFSLPSVDPSDVSKLTGWIPSHVGALSALICALPFPLEVLRMFPVKKLLDFGHSINSQAQRALIRHHSADDAVSAQVRAFCKKWASAVDVCPQGSARWSMTDNIKQWNRLEKLDDSLLTATVSRPIDPDKWAILNVTSLLLPSMFPKHEAVGHVMPETRAEEYWRTHGASTRTALGGSSVRAGGDGSTVSPAEVQRGIQGTSTYSGDGLPLRPYQPTTQARDDNHLPRRRSATVNARHELTVGFHTQNVMGFSKSDANPNAWFSHFRQTDDSGSLDIVFLQETHVLETEVASMQSRFRRSWGFQEPSEESDPRLPLWSASTERKGGVAILLNPYSCIPTLAPYKQDQWDAHWMAATVTLRGETVLLLNIYAPSTVFAMEAFYRALSGLLSSHDGPILQVSQHPQQVHDSRELKKLLQKLNLVDTLEDDALRATDTRDVKAFHRQHHTYYYTLPSGDSASSRLDRWYCSNDHLDWVRSVYQSVAGPFSDHNGVTIRVAAPDKVIQSKKPRVVYPLPKNAAAHAASIGKDFFEKAHDQLDELRGRYSSPRDYALATANWWDEAKIALRIGYLEAKKSYFARLNQGYKKKIQRLQRRLSESEVQMLDHSGGAVGDHNVELSQEFLTTATSIRRAIAECKSKWQASKRDRIFREHMHHERKTSKSFYKRISTKFLDNTIFTLGGTATYGPMRSRELADDMGEGWKSIMQQAPTLQTDIDQILDPGTAIPPSDRLGFLLKPIDSSEIKQAVKNCKRGKAHGPDELGNDWYRDHCDEITGLFERLFNLWIPECILPSSFSEVHIHCIKKSVSAASPLDYRPIALLNSDYKIFTRIFATRLRTVLPWLIHHMQAGFVPGRAIPTTIDVLLAAQQRATSDPAMSKAIALLLDFAKAYDSLDRSFLAQALQHLGFPLKFVHLVKVLHSQTTYKFIVNGFLSRKYNVTSGIRQGCPLAPLLFILALEVLYRKIEASDEIHGVELQAAGCATEVRIGGYADDTTIYLSDPKDINAVFAILDKYGAASGLRVNRHKSAVLPLNKEYSSTEESVSDIHVLQREEHCRYLGIQVGQTPSNASNWSKCIQALRVRLRLARLKTHSVAKRAAIASAVIIPKVLYVARHSWPSTAIVNQLHGLVKQFVWGSRNGLSVPNIRTELMTMSATAVSKWTITTSHIDQAIGEILLHNTRASSTYITPLDAIPRRPLQLRDNMWTTGAALCASLHSRPYEHRERDNVRWCYEHFKSTIVQTHWDGDVFQIDLSSKMSDRLPGIIAEGRKLRGTFCAEWLPYMTSTADGWLLDSNGSPYKLARTSLSVGTAQLGDILRWEWIRPGVLNFIPTCGISGSSRPSIRALERLCATLVSNFPQLLYRPQQANVLRLYNGQRHYNHEWHLHTSEATLTHVDTTLVKATHTVHSAMDCDVMATRDLNGQKVSFHAHPRFTRIVQLWGGNGRCNNTRSFYRQQVAATRTQIGKDTRDAAVNKAVHTAGSLWPGLQLIQWSELRNILGITVYTAQTLLRLKANRLSMWNYEKADLSCSNPECSQVVQSSVQHLFWECPRAKLVWNYFYALWTKIGITPGHDPAIWIFSLDLPDTPRHAWTSIKRHIIGHKCSNEHLQDHLYSVAHMLWRYMSASLIQAIWCAHLRRMDSDPIESTAEMAVMMTKLEAGMRNLTRLAEAQAGDSDGHTVAAVLKAYVDCFLSQTDAIPLTPNDARGVYLLFFDGGSRGNPGPGGTGSIIVRVHKDSHTAILIWAASMSYSRKDTTNNFAEYWGLIHGLREAQRSHFEPFECIGPLDSTDWHVYARQVDDSRIASTSEDGTITTVPSTRWRTQLPT